MYSKLTLVGAGPGDSELITLKGIRALQIADVVLYDALANDSLLDYAPQNAVKMNVGKRKGQHSFKQEEINDLIVSAALEYGHVVRLKGGDPFVFGRGYEELEYAKTFGIETEVIPGVSSSIGVAAAVQIPITHRDIARSFWVVTGHTSEGTLPKDLELAAQSSATVVILMGMSKLEEIAAIFTKYGKSEIPIAIIQSGTTGNQKSVFGQVQDIVLKVNESKVTNPAVIIIGEVVRLHPEYIEAYVAEMKF
ncbi:Uroporphyrinogen-III C-methyltransferase [Emticicia aquatica]|jgi:uroporphyrin-III C-methyltransferase|uniref:uroporphyrinogen-III C-methyltransferase n=1 Tax=Emticicia aquatica TaxID=1681835 RepID=A0ABM9ALS4_9BACT|nr:uroporphyrinogen-III C-methyltransferase [Emticicia aquatica]CAH0994738.1 Uroporphyrinogen-III C-methyltransferase [Emticicia aquatica]